MRAEQHIQAAQDLLIKSGQRLANGVRMQGSETLWGAAAHSIFPLSRLRQWSLESHPRLGESADRLSRGLGELHLSTDFDSTGRFHANFCHDFMTASDITMECPLVHRFVNRLLSLR